MVTLTLSDPCSFDTPRPLRPLNFHLNARSSIAASRVLALRRPTAQHAGLRSGQPFTWLGCLLIGNIEDRFVRLGLQCGRMDPVSVEALIDGLYKAYEVIKGRFGYDKVGRGEGFALVEALDVELVNGKDAGNLSTH